MLIEAEPQPDSPTRSTRLAHDLLAPLVQQRFRLSIAPGQRARRLLENRAPEWQDGKTGPVLDETDLATVEVGASGMRAWTADETRLVEASQNERKRMKRNRWLATVVASTVVIMTLMGFVAMGNQGWERTASNLVDKVTDSDLKNLPLDIGDLKDYPIRGATARQEPHQSGRRSRERA